MPIINLEYTNNIELPESSLQNFFSTLHTEMAEIIDTQVMHCKSKATKLASYLVGEGNNEIGFMLLTLVVLPGRSNEQKEHLNKIAADLLYNLVAKTHHQHEVQLRVLINEINSDYYEMRDYSPQ